jgi:hypothetical protein
MRDLEPLGVEVHPARVPPAVATMLDDPHLVPVPVSGEESL